MSVLPAAPQSAQQVKQSPHNQSATTTVNSKPATMKIAPVTNPAEGDDPKKFLQVSSAEPLSTQSRKKFCLHFRKKSKQNCTRCIERALQKLAEQPVAESVVRTLAIPEEYVGAIRVRVAGKRVAYSKDMVLLQRSKYSPMEPIAEDASVTTWTTTLSFEVTTAAA